MNFTDLNYVIEIDKHQSISLAAKKLFVAQSNLSRAGDILPPLIEVGASRSSNPAITA